MYHVLARGRFVLAALLVTGPMGCAASPTTPASDDGGGDALETRVTELVHRGAAKQKLKATFQASDTPYLRVDASQFEATANLVEQSLKAACRELGGTFDQGTYVFEEFSEEITRTRGARPSWPFANQIVDTRMLLMDISSEAGQVESSMYVSAACLLASRPGVEADVVVMGRENRPGHTPFDTIKPDDRKFYSQPELGRVYWASLASFDRYAERVPAIRAEYEARTNAIYASVRPAFDAHMAKRRAEIQAKDAAHQRAKARRESIAQAAEGRFTAATALPKQIGMTVCAADNRVGYVEQVAPPRVKVSVRGRAIATYQEFDQYGPYSLGSWGRPVPPTDPEPIEDRHFLFHPLPKPVRLSSESQVVWDEARYWAACNYR